MAMAGPSRARPRREDPRCHGECRLLGVSVVRTQVRRSWAASARVPAMGLRTAFAGTARSPVSLRTLTPVTDA